MGKIVLSAIVIMSFITYAVSARPKDTTPVVVPKSLEGEKITVGKLFIPTATPVLLKPAVSPIKPPITSIPQAATPQPIVPTDTPQPSSKYKNGTFSGSVQDAFYGNVQVQATISDGSITNVVFLQSPHEENHSIEVNQQADPMLAQEAIQAQSANVDIISGATATSQAFIQSLQSALAQAKS